MTVDRPSQKQAPNAKPTDEPHTIKPNVYINVANSCETDQKLLQSNLLNSEIIYLSSRKKAADRERKAKNDLFISTSTVRGLFKYECK